MAAESTGERPENGEAFPFRTTSITYIPLSLRVVEAGEDGPDGDAEWGGSNLGSGGGVGAPVAPGGRDTLATFSDFDVRDGDVLDLQRLGSSITEPIGEQAREVRFHLVGREDDSLEPLVFDLREIFSSLFPVDPFNILTGLVRAGIPQRLEIRDPDDEFDSLVFSMRHPGEADNPRQVTTPLEVDDAFQVVIQPYGFVVELAVRMVFTADI